MVFLNDSCKFDDKKKIGGFKCINGKWSKSECQVSHCNISYTFDTFKKECIGKTVKEQELENNKIFKDKFEEIEKKTNKNGVETVLEAKLISITDQN